MLEMVYRYILVESQALSQIHLFQLLLLVRVVSPMSRMPCLASYSIISVVQLSSNVLS